MQSRWKRALECIRDTVSRSADPNHSMPISLMPATSTLRCTHAQIRLHQTCASSVAMQSQLLSDEISFDAVHDCCSCCLWPKAAVISAGKTRNRILLDGRCRSTPATKRVSAPSQRDSSVIGASIQPSTFTIPDSRFVVGDS